MSDVTFSDPWPRWRLSHVSSAPHSSARLAKVWRSEWNVLQLSRRSDPRHLRSAIAAYRCLRIVDPETNPRSPSPGKASVALSVGLPAGGPPLGEELHDLAGQIDVPPLVVLRSVEVPVRVRLPDPDHATAEVDIAPARRDEARPAAFPS